MKKQKTRTYLLISIAVHILLLFIWVGTESYLERRDLRVQVEGKEEDPWVFEIIETPDFLKDEKPERPTNLVSDKSTRAADENPMTTRSLDIPYSPGEFMFKTNEQRASEASRAAAAERVPEADLGEVETVDLMGEGDQDRHYQIPARSVAFRNLTASLERRGGVSFNTYEWEFAPYMLAMKRRVERNLHPPYAFTHMGMVSGVNILRFTVLRDGTVRDLTILGSDAHFCLDRTSVRAIELSMPFMPLPDDFPEDVLEVTAQFSYILR
ncbi:MAG: energy transducer TonB [bacterium]|jgi:hypothetical protein